MAIVPLVPKPLEPPPLRSPALRADGDEEEDVSDEEEVALVGWSVGVKVDVSTITCVEGCSAGLVGVDTTVCVTCASDVLGVVSCVLVSGTVVVEGGMDVVEVMSGSVVVEGGGVVVSGTDVGSSVVVVGSVGTVEVAVSVSLVSDGVVSARKQSVARTDG